MQTERILSKAYRQSSASDFSRTSRSITPSDIRNADLGYEMHTVTKSRQETDLKVKLLDNRIQMLLRKDSNIKRATDNAQKKADYFMKNRERYITDVLKANRLKAEKQKELETIKEITQAKKQTQLNNVKLIHEEVILDKKQSARKIRKMVHMDGAKAREIRHLESRKKLGNKYVMKIEEDIVKQKRSMSQLNHKNIIREKYEAKLNIEKDLRNKSVRKLTELEELESALLLRLSDTMTQRNQAVSRLTSISGLTTPMSLPAPVTNP